MCVGYVTKSGRVVIPVERPGFLDEKEMDEKLESVYGISREELNHDLVREGLGRDSKYGRNNYGDILMPDATEQSVYIDPEQGQDLKGEELISWLTDQSTETVCKVWEIPSNRRLISGLLRYPGSFHEWLMVAAMPRFKEMEIPLKLIRDTRMKISECRFVYEKDGKKEEGMHGGDGSGHMHFRLLTYYMQAYEVWKKAKADGKDVDAKKTVAVYLKKFCEEFFDFSHPIPKSLNDLIKELNK